MNIMAFIKVLCVCVCLVMSNCDPMDYSLQGSSVHGILQARILEWVAIPFSKEFMKANDLESLLSGSLVFSRGEEREKSILVFFIDSQWYNK